MLHSHAKVTAKAVIAYVLSVPAMRRTRAHDLALSLSRNAPSIHIWVQKQLRAGRKSHTIKTALTLALNPTRTATWACRETGARVGHQQPILGLAYNVRMLLNERSKVLKATAEKLGMDYHRRRDRSSVKKCVGLASA